MGRVCHGLTCGLVGRVGAMQGYTGEASRNYWAGLAGLAGYGGRKASPVGFRDATHRHANPAQGGESWHRLRFTVCAPLARPVKNRIRV